MIFTEIISRKRDGHKLTEEEIRFCVTAFTAGTMPDYQMAALLMAVFIRGFDHDEAALLTSAMADSGAAIDLSGIPGPCIDKHSTGGVGDGTSLVAAPLAACAGIVVPMMSGRTLGHTGGTLDKLESIPGFQVNLSESAYRRQLATIGVALIGQNEQIAPADKKMYALRDVTATVDSIPLIAASIMSKKLVEGSTGLVLDVKAGNGAFMRTTKEAADLANLMISIGKSRGMKMRGFITDMNQPLGSAVGNALEIHQAIEVMKGRGPEDFVGLVIELAAAMVVLGGAETGFDAARARLRGLLADGTALDKFKMIIQAQGGDPRVIDAPERLLPQASIRTVLTAPVSGYVAAMDTRAIGIAAQVLGAGRFSKNDAIDHAAGLMILKKTGDRVERGEPIAELFGNAAGAQQEAQSRVHAAYAFSDGPVSPPQLIYQEIA